jgi:hypothetical protein
MPDVVVRIGVLMQVSMLTWFLVWSGQRFVDKQHRCALAAPPQEQCSGADRVDTCSGSPAVRILAFSSVGCHQCHRLQTSALQRVLEMRGANVAVVEVDAASSPELTQRYQVLTVPTTVVLDATGRVHAVNCGFTNTRRLFEQVDEVLKGIS